MYVSEENSSGKNFHLWKTWRKVKLYKPNKQGGIWKHKKQLWAAKEDNGWQPGAKACMYVSHTVTLRGRCKSTFSSELFPH